jgi:nitrogen-specific signal transduction histidine kinase/CheY-like chemotaxis protein
MMVSAFSIFDSSGNVVSVAVHSRDITEAKRAEASRLQTERLRALGELASGVAHDFNNALTGILGYTNILRYQVKEPAVLRDLEVIEKCAQDAAQIVRRMQAFYKVHAEAQMIPINLKQLLMDVLDLTRPRWKDRPEVEGISINIVLQFTEVPSIEGNPTELREMFTNLVLNALDAMPQGGTLTIQTDSSRRPQGASLRCGRQVEVSVADTGMGMDSETKRRCFEAFFTTKGEKGTGLGLSLVYNIANRHGGTIEVESELGQGSVFVVFLPVAKDYAEPESREEIPTATRAIRVLVIDDEEIVRLVVKEMLQVLGHQVTTAATGLEGLEAFHQGNFDLVITDLGMPRMNGFQVAQSIKALRRDIPVILLTGWGDQFEGESLKAQQIDRVLRKPLQVADLAKALAPYAGNG